MARTIGIVMVVTGALVALLVVLAMRSRGPAPAADELRIVALSPALAITLVDLGLEEHIVGRHGWDYVLDKGVAVCGDQSGIDFEVLLSTEPTHVLTEWGAQEVPQRLVALAEEKGWVLHDFSMLSLDEVCDGVVTLASLFEDHVEPLRPELIGAAARTPQALLETMIPSGESKYAGRVLLLWPTNPPAAVGPGSFHQEVFERVGGRPVIERGQAYIELDAEAILSLAPDAVLVISPRDVGTAEGDASWASIEARLKVVADLDVPAIRDRRVAVLDHPLSLTPSTALIDVGVEMREALEGWAEADDPSPRGR